MYHDFWLLEEGAFPYADYQKFLSRKDAPLRVPDDLLRYFSDMLSWIPSWNPALSEMPPMKGLNWYGPTIINQGGADLFFQIFTVWSHLFGLGPERVTLRGFFVWHWPFPEQEHLLREEQLLALGQEERLDMDREELVQILTTLANFGKQATTGTSFILHIGI